MIKKILFVGVLIILIASAYLMSEKKKIETTEVDVVTTEDSVAEKEPEQDNNLEPEEFIENVALEVKLSSDSVGVGVIRLSEYEGGLCYLIEETDKCSYGIFEGVRLVAEPEEGFGFGEWVSGCDSVATTNLDNDTCEIGSHSSKKNVEVRFVKLEQL